MPSLIPKRTKLAPIRRWGQTRSSQWLHTTDHGRRSRREFKRIPPEWKDIVSPMRVVTRKTVQELVAAPTKAATISAPWTWALFSF